MRKHDPTLADVAAALEVSFDGHHYFYGGYRYENAADALRYARVRHDMPGYRPDPDFRPNWPPAWEPDARQSAAMRELGIVLEDGRFRYGAYRYDRLDDAVAFASRARGS